MRWTACISRTLWVLLAACGAPTTPQPPQEIGTATHVHADSGWLDGSADVAAVSFRAVPYAAPPLGALRWRPPQPVTSWQGSRDARTDGPQCAQGLPANAALDAASSEDCLTLNVFTPVGAKAPLPVIVYLHGGANVVGGADDGIGSYRYYDGRALAARGAVVVIVQYRLGLLGFLAHEALAEEDAHGSTGNYGLLDQLAALNWVQRNIAAFGGDRSRVLLAGQSAGAVDACSLMASPLAAGLFSRALFLSETCGTIDRASGLAQGGRVANALGCGLVADRAACMRGKSATELIAAMGDPALASAGPLVDGYVVPADPWALIQAGTYNKVPVIVSNTANEWTTLLGYFGTHPITSEGELTSAVHGFFPDISGAQALSIYPLARYQTYNEVLITFLSDALLFCPGRRLARAMSDGGEPTWRAVFGHTYSSGPYRDQRAGHGMDVPFVFDTLALPQFVATSDEQALAQQIGDYYVHFAATGDPNHADAPPWSAYDSALDNALFLDVISREDSKRESAACDALGF